MEITVVEGKLLLLIIIFVPKHSLKGHDRTVYSCKPSDTLLTLKETIESDEEIEPESQSIYFSGYWLSEDNILLSDFLKNGDELILSFPTASGGPTKCQSNIDVWIVNGNKTQLVPKSRSVPVTLKSNRFGLIRHKEGLEPGTRIYQVERFLLNEDDNIVLETEKGITKVFLNGTLVDPTDVSVYDESNIKTKTEDALDYSNISANIDRFIHAISTIINPGIQSNNTLVFNSFNVRC
jgi:hypothetical protein